MPCRSRATRARRQPPNMADVPQNAGYMVAAYIVTGVILLGYAVSLGRRSRNL